VTAPYLERLGARSALVGSVLCVGLDPDPANLPAGFPADVTGVERFARLIVDATAPFAAAFKPNLAFFEAFGSAGLAALERVRAAVPGGIPVIVDAKRGDIGTTAERQAVALFDALDADAVTLSPYLGREAVEPFTVREDRFAYVLCRTSNPGAMELQGLPIHADDTDTSPAEPLHLRVARRAAGWGPAGRVGLVVGATAPDDLAAVRAIAPDLAFFIPGVGAQGGSIEPVLRHGPAIASAAALRPGAGLLVNVSRGIAAAALGGGAGERPGDPGERLAEAAREWAGKLPVLPLPDVQDRSDRA
jgi:orotidine-5'-phosphate decarboxylase